MSELTQIAALLRYDGDTGVFYWLVDVRKGRGAGYIFKPAGSVAGYSETNGYTVIRVLGREIKAHRLAWLFGNGSWPEGHIDHINRNRSDNRLANLRCVSRAINAQNQGRPQQRAGVTHSSGYLGVHWDKCRARFKAEIGVNGKNKNLGFFRSAEEAYEVYVAAKRRLHPGGVL